MLIYNPTFVPLCNVHQIFSLSCLYIASCSKPLHQIPRLKILFPSNTYNNIVYKSDKISMISKNKWKTNSRYDMFKQVLQERQTDRQTEVPIYHVYILPVYHVLSHWQITPIKYRLINKRKTVSRYNMLKQVLQERQTDRQTEVPIYHVYILYHVLSHWQITPIKDIVCLKYI